MLFFRLEKTKIEEKEVSVTEYSTFLYASALRQKKHKSSEEEQNPIILKVQQHRNKVLYKSFMSQSFFSMQMKGRWRLQKY